MPRIAAIKDHLLESRLFLRRSVAAVVFSALLVGALVARLAYLQVIAFEHFDTLSTDNRVKLVPVPPSRGLIYDRNGTLLAENLPSYRLELVPEQIKDMDGTLTRLGEIVHLREFDLNRFHKLLGRMRRFDGVPLRFHLSDEEVARFAVNRHRFPGVDIEAGLTRHYPLGAQAAHAIGYVGRINEEELAELDTSNYRGTTHIGKTGVEKTYEDILHGSVGYEQVETNAQGRPLRVLERQDPQPGQNIYLSLDARLQSATEAAFAGRNGSAVAIDPRNGEVLMLVSTPGFDPNAFVNGIEVKDYRALTSNPDQPLFNRALRGQYPPGSTLKPFVGLAGLELHVTGEHSTTYCPGFYMLPGKERKYRDWKRSGHGTVDLTAAVAQSCDVYFYDLARSLGIDRMHDFLAQFGFGARTGIDIVGELPGLLPSTQWKREKRGQAWFPGETLIAGIGQGFNLTTPLQLAVATGALARYGERHQPHIVQSIRDRHDGQLTPNTGEALAAIPISQRKHWDRVLHSMVEVVHGVRGTARRIGTGIDYQIGGKTGTAQVFGLAQEEEYEEEEIAEKLRDHALFIAYAPADDPRIAVAVIVENGGSGGAVAAPVARAVLDRFFMDNPP